MWICATWAKIARGRGELKKSCCCDRLRTVGHGVFNMSAKFLRHVNSQW